MKMQQARLKLVVAVQFLQVNIDRNEQFTLQAWCKRLFALKLTVGLVTCYSKYVMKWGGQQDYY